MSERITDIPDLIHLWKYNNLYLAGQPGERAWSELKDRGVKTVINMRAPNEGDFDKDKSTAQDLGMEYHLVPLIEDGKISKNAAMEISEKVKSAGEAPILVHCGSANRVAGWLMIHLTKNGMDFEEAVKVAQENGLSNPGFIEQAQEIIQS